MAKNFRFYRFLWPWINSHLVSFLEDVKYEIRKTNIFWFLYMIYLIKSIYFKKWLQKSLLISLEQH